MVSTACDLLITVDVGWSGHPVSSGQRTDFVKLVGRQRLWGIVSRGEGKSHVWKSGHNDPEEQGLELEIRLD